MQFKFRYFSKLALGILVAFVVAAAGVPTSQAEATERVDEEAIQKVLVGKVAASKVGVRHERDGRITCSFWMANPHQSTTPGRGHMWNVKGHWDCRYDSDNSHARVDILSVAPRLYENGEQVSAPQQKIQYDRYSMHHNAASQCTVGEVDAGWQGKGSGYVKFPEGYHPPDASLSHESDQFMQGFDCDFPPVR